MVETKAKTPTKDQFMAAMFPVAIKLMQITMDGKIDQNEWLDLATTVVNTGFDLYGVECKIVKKIPKLVPNIQE